MARTTHAYCTRTQSPARTPFTTVSTADSPTTTPPPTPPSKLIRSCSRSVYAQTPSQRRRLTTERVRVRAAGLTSARRAAAAEPAEPRSIRAPLHAPSPGQPRRPVRRRPHRTRRSATGAVRAPPAPPDRAQRTDDVSHRRRRRRRRAPGAPTAGRGHGRAAERAAPGEERVPGHRRRRWRCRIECVSVRDERNRRKRSERLLGRWVNKRVFFL